MRDIDRRSAARPTRDDIAIALDGSRPDRDNVTDDSYRAALSLLESVMPQRFDRLRQLGATGLVAASDRFDDMHRLLRLLRVDTIATSAILDDESWPGILFIGCQRLTAAGHSRWFEQMLGRGAIVVSSDQSASVAAVRSRIRLSKRRPVRRARLARSNALTGGDRAAGWTSLPDGYFPAVRLAAGHLPLARQPRSVTVLANDRLTRTPQIVLATVGGGQVLHSVAHWWQEVEPDSTAIGQLSVSDVPALANLGRDFPRARFGDLGAALALLDCLVTGVDLALDRAGILRPRGEQRVSTS